MNIIKEKRGFTLIELLIAMAIFVLFMTVLINTYTFVVKAQRETNERRQLYVEARKVFDAVTLELRDGMVDYGRTEGDCVDGDSLCLVAKDFSKRSMLYLENDAVHITVDTRDPFTGAFDTGNTITLNSPEVLVQKFDYKVTPTVDPYDLDYAAYDNVQFHPMLTLDAEFVMPNYPDEVLKLQTTISSRIYNQVYDY